MHSHFYYCGNKSSTNLFQFSLWKELSVFYIALDFQKWIVANDSELNKCSCFAIFVYEFMFFWFFRDFKGLYFITSSFYLSFHSIHLTIGVVCFNIYLVPLVKWQDIWISFFFNAKTIFTCIQHLNLKRRLFESKWKGFLL